MTDEELLAAYEAAIVAVLEGGQEYEVNGKKFRRADLKDLTAARDALKKKIGLSTGPRTSLGVMDPRY